MRYQLNFPCTLGEKSKSVSFSRVYVCVKAKLTLVSFFLLFYFVHLPLKAQGIRSATVFRMSLSAPGIRAHA